MKYVIIVVALAALVGCTKRLPEQPGTVGLAKEMCALGPGGQLVSFYSYASLFEPLSLKVRANCKANGREYKVELTLGKGW